MKKLKLSLDDLEVSTFVAQDRGVFGMDEATLWCHVSEQTRCLCTNAAGCYPSLYCSGAGPGEPNQTCYEGCMTNENGAC